MSDPKQLMTAAGFISSRVYATAGLVAYPQLLGDAPPPGRWWTLDPPLHQPILQQGVVLKNAAHPTAALALLDFLQGPAAMVIMIRYGYLIPEN